MGAAILLCRAHDLFYCSVRLFLCTDLHAIKRSTAGAVSQLLVPVVGPVPHASVKLAGPWERQTRVTAGPFENHLAGPQEGQEQRQLAHGTVGDSLAENHQ